MALTPFPSQDNTNTLDAPIKKQSTLTPFPKQNSTLLPFPKSEPAAKPTGEGLGARVWGFAKDVGKEIVRSTAEAGMRLGTLAAGVMGAATGSGFTQASESAPETISTPFGEIHSNYSEDTHKAIGEVWTDAINAGLSIEGVGISSAVKGTVKQTAEAALKYGVKRTSTDAVLGAGMGLAETAQQKDATAADYAENAAKDAAIFAALPHVIGFGVRGAGAVIGKTKKEMAGLIEGAATKLEAYAEPAKKEASHVLDELYPHLNDYMTPAQRKAKALAGGLRTLQKLPSEVAYNIDRWNPLKQYIDKYSAVNGTDSLTAEQTARIGASRGFNSAKQRITNVLDQIIKKNSDIWADTEKYMLAKSDAEQAAMGMAVQGGRTAEELQAAVGHFEATTDPARLKRIQQLSKEVSDFNRATYKRAVDAGLVSREAFDAAVAKYQNYFPHERMDFDKEASFFEGPTGKGSTKSMNVGKSPVQEAKGSERLVKPLEQQMKERLIKVETVAAKNEATRSIFEMGEKVNPDGFERIKEPLKDVDVPKEKGQVSWFEDGKKVTALVPKDVEKAIKYLDSETVKAAEHWIFRTLQIPSKITRTLATGLNPIFAIFKNPARDIQTQAFTTAGSRVRASDYAASLWEMITGKSESLDELTSLLSDSQKKAAKEYGIQNLKQLAEFSGSFMGTVYNEGELNSMEKLLDRAGNPFWSRVKSLNPVKAVEEVGQKMEEMSRLAAFRRGLYSGMGAEKAALYARDATVDFEKYGPALQTLNKYVPFLNARVQGFRNLAKKVTEQPELAARSLMWTAALPTVGLYAHNSRYKSYSDISSNLKNNYWIVMYDEEKARDTDGKMKLFPVFVAIPKGEAQQSVSNLIESTLDMGRTKYPDSTAKMLLQFGNDLSPIKESSILPTAIQTPVELMTNFNLFTGKPIEGGESGYIYTPAGPIKRGELDTQHRYSTYTSEVAKELSKHIGFLSPIQIDKMLSVGLLTDLLQFTTPKRKGGSAALRATQTPFIDDIIKTSTTGDEEAKKDVATEKMKERTAKRIDKKVLRDKIKEARSKGEDIAPLQKELGDLLRSK